MAQTDPKQITELIKKAEYEDWTMLMLADLIGHSRDCTTYMCLRMNGGEALECCCGIGIDGAPPVRREAQIPSASVTVAPTQIVEAQRRPAPAVLTGNQLPTDQERVAVDIKRRHAALVVLGILINGQPILVEGDEYRYDDGVFGIVRKRIVNGRESGEVIIGLDMNVGEFVKWCERLPEEVLIQGVFNNVVKTKLGD